MFQEIDRLSDPVVGAIASSLGEDQPRQRKVLELADIVELVLGREAALARPAPCLGQPPIGDPRAGLQRTDRAYLGRVVRGVQAVGLGKERSEEHTSELQS